MRRFHQRDELGMLDANFEWNCTVKLINIQLPTVTRERAACRIPGLPDPSSLQIEIIELTKFKSGLSMNVHDGPIRNYPVNYSDSYNGLRIHGTCHGFNEILILVFLRECPYQVRSVR